MKHFTVRLFCIFLLAVATCTSGYAEDVTLPIRLEAGKMASLLVRCGLSKEDAQDIALSKMPRGIKWWESEFLPRFSADQRSLLTKQLDRYLDIRQKSSEYVSRAEFLERVILALLQQEKGLTSAQLFDPWQAGLLNQSEDWWKQQMESLSPTKQDQLNNLRKQLILFSQKAATEAGAGVSPSAISRPTVGSSGYSVTIPSDWNIARNAANFDIAATLNGNWIGIYTSAPANANTAEWTQLWVTKYSKIIPNAKFKVTGAVKIAGQSWDVVDGTFQDSGTPLTCRMFTYSTVDRSYSIVFCADTAHFQPLLPTFQAIAASFTFPAK